MFRQYEKGICAGCGRDRYLFNKKKRLCQTCAAKPAKAIKSRTPKQAQVKKKDMDYYRAAWNSVSDAPRRCQECATPLIEFSPCHISHIIAKHNTGLRWDLNNFMLYCLSCHHTYEFGDRTQMKTFPIFEEKRNQLSLKYYGEHR